MFGRHLGLLRSGAMSSQNKGLVPTVAAFAVWGLFPLYFHLLNRVSALEVTAHRVAWACVFVLVVARPAGRTRRVPRETHRPRSSLAAHRIGNLDVGQLARLRLGRHAWPRPRGESRLFHRSLGERDVGRGAAFREAHPRTMGGRRSGRRRRRLSHDHDRHRAVDCAGAGLLVCHLRLDSQGGQGRVADRTRDRNRGTRTHRRGVPAVVSNGPVRARSAMRGSPSMPC